MIRKKGKRGEDTNALEISFLVGQQSYQPALFNVAMGIAVKAMRRYRRLQEMKRLFRCVEVLAALFLLSWSFVHLRTASHLSGDLIRRLAILFVSPHFVFVLGNAIILVLFAKSGHSPRSPAATSTPADDGCDEFVERRRRMVQCSTIEVEYEDKNVCAEGRACGWSRSERLERGLTIE